MTDKVVGGTPFTVLWKEKCIGEVMVVVVGGERNLTN